MIGRLHTRRSGTALIGLLAALGLITAACGDDGGSSESAPDFELPKSAGGTVALQDYEGEPVLLYFHMAEG